MIELVQYLAYQTGTFLYPMIYSFKYLKNGQSLNIKKILKFWCCLCLFFLLEFFMYYAISEALQPFISLGILALLNIKQFIFAEKLFDTLIIPLYMSKKDDIMNISNKIQQNFNKKSDALQAKVKNTAGDNFKKFVGEILLSTLNPHLNNNAKPANKEQDSDKQD